MSSHSQTPACTFPVLTPSPFPAHCSISNDEKVLKDPRTAPHVVVGTPGRILALCSPDKPAARSLDLSKVKHFVLDECDKMLESLGMHLSVSLPLPPLLF